MGTINLGKIKPLYKGDYSGSVTYKVLDFVRYNNSLYVCKLDSIGNLPTNTTYFDNAAYLQTPSEILTSIKTVDGTGSGLDADLLDGLHSSSFMQKISSTDNAIVRFDGTTGAVQNSGVIINDDGNVGIGTNSPNAKLHTRVSNSSAVVDGILIENFINDNPSGGNGVSVGFNLNDNGNDSTTRGRIGIINTFFGSKTDMLFHIFNSGLIEKMRLTSNGNLLIGTSTDNGVDKLQVNGDVNINGNLISKSIQGIKSDFVINDDSALLISNGLSVAEGLYAITARSPDFQASLNLLFFVSFHKFEGVSFNLISKGGRNTTAMADKVDFRTDIVGTGTTGIDGRISICCMANNASLEFALYIENRHGSVITNVSITKLN